MIRTPREQKYRRDRIERVLRDDELVRAGNAYLADEEEILSLITGSVAELKRLIGAKEIRNFDFPGRMYPELLPVYFHPTAEQRRWGVLAHADAAKAAAQGIRAALAMPRPTGEPA